MAQLPTIREPNAHRPRAAFAPRWKSLKPCTRWQPPTTTSGPRSVHPDNEDVQEPSFDDLVQRAALPKVVIGETGLDYFRWASSALTWHGSERFRAYPCGEANWPAAGDSHRNASDDTRHFEGRR
jgi:hypothetical protein